MTISDSIFEAHIIRQHTNDSHFPSIFIPIVNDLHRAKLRMASIGHRVPLLVLLAFALQFPRDSSTNGTS